MSSIEERRTPESQARKLAISIYPNALKPFAQSFFNRNNLWEQRLQASILKKQPIQMIGFWGIGGKERSDRYDEKLLSEYEAIREAIGKQYPQSADMMIILAKPHARFNGYQGFDGYLESVASEANKRQIASISLDDLYQEWKIVAPDNQPIDKESQEWINFIIRLKEEGIAQRHGQRGNKPLVQFVESAEKHGKVGMSPEEAAFRYLQMRRQESEPLSRSFPDGILLINGSEGLGREFLPINMPHLYMKVGPVWYQHDY